MTPAGINLARLMTPHRFRPEGCEWALTPLGIVVDGGLPERTDGAPITMRAIWATRGELIRYYASAYSVPCELIMATIATESRPPNNASSIRLEDGYVSDERTPSKCSFGLMQVLLSTAREVLAQPSLSREFLLTPAGSIQAGTGYIAKQASRTGYDPPAVAAAYNAGGIYQQLGPENRWKWKQYPIGTGEHCDRWVRWFGDALAVLREGPSLPDPCFASLL